MPPLPDEKRSLPREAQRAFLQVVNSAEMFVERARKQRDEFEQRIESEVHATLARVRAPIDRELEAMKGRLEKLGEKLDSLRKRRAG